MPNLQKIGVQRVGEGCVVAQCSFPRQETSIAGHRKNCYQPVSRILFPSSTRAKRRAAIIYLAPALLQGSSCLPSGVGPCGPSDEPPSTTGIRGISACKVYPRRRLPAGTVGSYPTFSSSPRDRRSRRRAVIFCGTICERLRAPRLLTGALPFAVRTFLPR